MGGNGRELEGSPDQGEERHIFTVSHQSKRTVAEMDRGEEFPSSRMS